MFDSVKLLSLVLILTCLSCAKTETPKLVASTEVNGCVYKVFYTAHTDYNIKQVLGSKYILTNKRVKNNTVWSYKYRSRNYNLTIWLKRDLDEKQNGTKHKTNKGR